MLLLPFLLAVAPLPSSSDGPLGKLAALAGHWVVVDTEGAATDLRARYRVAAGGAAVIETMLADTKNETVTVYHTEGAAVTATQVGPRGAPRRLLPASSRDKGAVSFVVRDKDERTGRVGSVRLTFLDENRLRIDWSFPTEQQSDGQTFELRRERPAKQLAAEVARMRLSLEAMQRELDLRIKREIKVKEKGKPVRTLFETRTLPPGPGWNVSGVPLRMAFVGALRYASTFAGEGDAGMSVAHYAFRAGADCRLRFSVVGGHGYIAVVEESRAAPRRIQDIPEFSKKLMDGEYGVVIERIVGGKWKAPRAVEWDLARFQGKQLRLYVVDAAKNHYGQIGISEIAIVETGG